MLVGGLPLTFTPEANSRDCASVGVICGCVYAIHRRGAANLLSLHGRGLGLSVRVEYTAAALLPAFQFFADPLEASLAAAAPICP